MKMRALAFVCLLVVTMGCTIPTTPTPPAPPAPKSCETNHTGTLTVTNGAPDGTARTIYIDGVNFGILNYGQSLTITRAAGTKLQVQFYRTSNSQFIQQGTATITQCAGTGMSGTAATAPE